MGRKEKCLCYETPQRDSEPQKAAGCACAKIFDSSFPYKDFPPPAPPDGDTDSWELQFCRWWGWNWVKKGPQPKQNSLEPKDSCPAECQTKGKPKKASFSPEKPEVRYCQKSPTFKEQITTMCKCLTGQNKEACYAKMMALYNTPSSSQIKIDEDSDESQEEETEECTCKACGKQKKAQKPANKKKKTFFCCPKASSPSSDKSKRKHKPKERKTKSMQATCDQDSSDSSAECPCTTDTKASDNSASHVPKEMEHACGPCISHCEKVFDLRGKKYKTLCVMVCACNACNNGGKSLKIQDKFITNPVLLSQDTSKVFSKFGTPTRNYPWMQNVGSTGTTTSLHTIPNDISELLTTNYHSEVKLPGLLDISEDLTYLKHLKDVGRSGAENRILLDAVCDAILYDNDGSKSKLLEGLYFKEKPKRDSGVLCTLKNHYDCADVGVFTEFSSTLINTDDIGVQLSNLEESNQPQGDSSDLSAELKNYNASLGLETMSYQIHAAVTKTTRGEEGKKQNEERVSDRIEDIFSKIEYIVHKSKERSADVQRVLGGYPKGPELEYENSEMGERNLDMDLMNQEHIEPIEHSRLNEEESKSIPSTTRTGAGAMSQTSVASRKSKIPVRKYLS